MTRDDIIRMADQAFDESSVTNLEVLRFAALVAAAERERAITIAKDMKEGLQAKFEQTYMEGVIAGAAAEREACAYRAGIALLGADRGLSNRVDQAIRARGQE